MNPRHFKAKGRTQPSLCFIKEVFININDKARSD